MPWVGGMVRGNDFQKYKKIAAIAAARAALIAAIKGICGTDTGGQARWLVLFSNNLEGDFN